MGYAEAECRQQKSPFHHHETAYNTFFSPALRPQASEGGSKGKEVAVSALTPLFGVGPGFFAYLLNIILLLVSLFLILVVLIQRGKGGGLAGAFGGVGGSSAFGSRAGDAFTRFTLIVAAIWVLLIMILDKMD
jgi:protein translocase SecG subunit